MRLRVRRVRQRTWQLLSLPLDAARLDVNHHESQREQPSHDRAHRIPGLDVDHRCLHGHTFAEATIAHVPVRYRVRGGCTLRSVSTQLVAWGRRRAPDDRCWFPLMFAFIPPVANEKYTSYTAIAILFPFLIVAKLYFLILYVFSLFLYLKYILI